MSKDQTIEAPQVPTFEGGEPPGGNQDGENVGSIGNDAEGYRSEAYSFDSTALERAAKAAKVLCCVFKLLYFFFTYIIIYLEQKCY